MIEMIDFGPHIRVCKITKDLITHEESVTIRWPSSGALSIEEAETFSGHLKQAIDFAKEAEDNLPES